jgi:hypothetical protein
MSKLILPSNFLINLIIHKKWRVFRHMLMVILLALLFYPSLDIEALKKANIDDITQFVTAMNRGAFCMFLISLICIYINLIFLTPTFLLKNKFGSFIVSISLLAVLYFLTENAVSYFFLKDVNKQIPIIITDLTLKGFIDSAFLPLVFLGATSGYEVFKKWIFDNQKYLALQELNTREELTNLKNQINPHFLFNTLNNLHTLINVHPAKASAVVLGLSDVLRYQLYESTGDKVLLKKDIEIMEQFLELEKIRRDNFQFSVQVENDLAGITVPPFIFMGFVENAVKHSADNKGFSFISIEIKTTLNQILFSCKNSKPAFDTMQYKGGIGLSNIKRRLQILYENEYLLHLEQLKNEFCVSLTLPLQKF